MKTIIALLLFPLAVFASYAPSSDFLIEVAKGNVVGHSIVNKFGFDDSVTNTLVPISDGGVYQTPTVAVSLEFISSDIDDTSAGAGARELTIIGLNSIWVEQTITVATNGTTAAAIPSTWLRVYRAYVSESGTYATQGAGSHEGTLTIRESGAGATWATIGLAVGGFPVGQTEIGAYTIPAGFTGYLLSKHISIQSTKVPNILWFQRSGGDNVTAPFDGMRLFERHQGAAPEITYSPPAPAVIMPEKTDVGAMAYLATGTAAVSVEFQILLVAN